MNFRQWVESIWYHGTQSGDDIRRTGRFDVSTSGGGQRGLMGVWLTKDPKYAEIYSKALRENPRNPEVLEVEVPDNLKIADLHSVESPLQHLDAEKARWKFVGYDIDDRNSMQPVRDMQPFALTKLLQQKGYDGALIPNTIHKNGMPELVIFDSARLKLL